MDELSGENRRRCPICGRPSEDRFRPFCSRRCADVDLARWLGGAYAVPVVETDEDEEAALEDSDPEATDEAESGRNGHG